MEAQERTLTKDDYLAADGISQSRLKMAVASPQLYEQYLRGLREPDPPTASQQFGMDVEEYLKTDKMPRDVVLIPKDVLASNGARRGKAWEAFMEAHPGARLLKQKEYRELQASLIEVRGNVEEHDQAAALVWNLDPVWHHQMFWECPITGLRRKGEIDLMIKDRRIVADIKTASDTDPRAFQRAAISFGYLLQAATYLEGIEQTFEEDVEDWRFMFVVVRNTLPYDVRVFLADPEAIAYGRRLNEQYMIEYASMSQANVWRPQDWGSHVLLTVPKWAEL